MFPLALQLINETSGANTQMSWGAECFHKGKNVIFSFPSKLCQHSMDFLRGRSKWNIFSLFSGAEKSQSTAINPILPFIKPLNNQKMKDLFDFSVWKKKNKKIPAEINRIKANQTQIHRISRSRFRDERSLLFPVVYVIFSKFWF